MHTFISTHKFQVALFEVKDSLKLRSLVLELLTLYFLLCVADFNLSENRHFLYLSYTIYESISKGPVCTRLRPGFMRPTTHRWHLICQDHVLFQCIYKWMHALITEISVALSSYWNSLAVQYNKVNWTICHYSSMLFSSYFSISILLSD